MRRGLQDKRGTVFVDDKDFDLFAIFLDVALPQPIRAGDPQAPNLLNHLTGIVTTDEGIGRHRLVLIVPFSTGQASAEIAQALPA